MGMHDQTDDKRRQTKRGKTNVPGRLAGLGQGAQISGSADWGAAHERWVLSIIIEVTKRGGMASFGLSRDSGAFNVTILLDNDRRTVWIPGGDEVDARLEEIVHFLASLPD
jgi:hypothetical protein